MSSEDPPPTAMGIGRRQREDALALGPRKKARISDPLVLYGQYFGQMVHALCNVKALLSNGILRMRELADAPEEFFIAKKNHEHHVFTVLLQMVPGLEGRLMEGSNNDLTTIAEMIQKGVLSCRSDNTKTLKGAILDWIVPRGQSLDPPLDRNIKADCGFCHERTGALLCPTGMDWTDPETKEQLRSGKIMVSGDQWPLFLYSDCEFNPEDPWRGLFKSSILVSAYKHVFTLPSSVNNGSKATCSGNAKIHGMKRVTPASITYIATQVQFALTSSAVFSRTDTATDSERFYTSVMEYFEDSDEQTEVDDLLAWWNQQIFPSYLTTRRPVAKNSALVRIKEKRALRKLSSAQSG